MFWYNGEAREQNHLELNINDPGLLYGATVFTTMRVYHYTLTHPLTNYAAHCDRLRQSIKIFGWQQPNWQKLQQGAELLSAFFPVLRIVVFPDGREWVTGRNLPPNLNQHQQQGIIAWVAEDNLYQRDLAAHKTGNYLGAYLARQKAQQLGAQEAILIDCHGNWLETSTGNLWGYHNGYWYTPALSSGILPGVARAQLLTWLKQNQTSVTENIWTPEFINSLTAIAYSNCVVEVIPIRTIITPQSTSSEYTRANPAKYLQSYFQNN